MDSLFVCSYLVLPQESYIPGGLADGNWHRVHLSLGGQQVAKYNSDTAVLGNVKR